MTEVIISHYLKVFLCLFVYYIIIWYNDMKRDTYNLTINIEKPMVIYNLKRK